MKRNFADLHLHTTASDGSVDAKELIVAAYRRGFRTIAITDHNRFTFREPFEIGNKGDEMLVLPGAEHSAVFTVPGSGERLEVHVVSLFPSGMKTDVFALDFHRCRRGKDAFFLAILQNLAEKEDIHISVEDLAASAVGKRGSTGRMIIAAEMVNRGICSSIDEAFDRYIGFGGSCFRPSTDFIRFPKLRDTVGAISNAGGIPILAHPLLYPLSPEDLEALFAEFASAATGPAAGCEVYYEKYLRDPEKVERLKNLADRYGLLYSVASDKHHRSDPFSSKEDGADLYDQMMRRYAQL